MSNEWADPDQAFSSITFLFAVETFHFLNRPRPVYHQSDQ